MIIETERLVLRPWEDADAGELYLLARDPAIGNAAGWPAITSEAMSLDVLRNVLRGEEHYAIALRQSAASTLADGSREPSSSPSAAAGPLVGAIALKGETESDLVTSPAEYELGYWIAKQNWGQGLAPEAADALIEHARHDLGCTAIWADFYCGNERSRRVMEKCGLVYVRTRRDVPVPLLGEIRDTVVMRRDLAAESGKA